MTFLKTHIITCTDFHRGATEKSSMRFLMSELWPKWWPQSRTSKFFLQLSRPRKRKFFKTFIYIHGSRPHLWLKFWLLLKSVVVCLPIHIISVEYFFILLNQRRSNFVTSDPEKRGKNQFFYFLSIIFVFYHNFKFLNEKFKSE